jgi:hypothetical protein
MAARLMGKIERQANQNFAAAAWILERNFPADFSRPEIQHQISTHHTVVNSLAITVSPDQAQQLAARAESTNKTVAGLFAAWKNHQAGTPLDEDPAQPSQEPQQL